MRLIPGMQNTQELNIKSKENKRWWKVKMEKISGKMIFRVLIVMALMVVMVEGQFAENGNLYTCWGGCYNQCVLLDRSSAGAGSFPCYVGCLSSCVPQTAAQYQNYCQIGCSVQRCFPSITDGAQLENCFRNCGNACGL